MNEKLPIPETEECPISLVGAEDCQDFDRNKATKLQLQERTRRIAETYSYSEELTENLMKIVPEMAEDCGNPELVIQTLRECPIHVQEKGENMSKFLKSYFPDASISPAIIASGVFIAMPEIRNDKVVLRKVLYLKNNARLSTLVHELGHAIVTTGRDPAVEADGKIRVDIGVASEYYVMDDDGLMVEVGSKNFGLEELLNTEAENRVMQKVLEDATYASDNYPLLHNIAMEMPPKLLSAYNADRIRNTEEDASQLLSPESRQRIKDDLDTIVGNFTLGFSEIKKRGIGNIIAENRVLSNQVIDIFNKVKW